MKSFFIVLLLIANSTYAMQKPEDIIHQEVIKWLPIANSQEIQWVIQNKYLNLEQKDSNGDTLLHAMAEKGDPKLFEIIGNTITTNAKNTKNNAGKEPLDIITENILTKKGQQLKNFKKCKKILNLNVATLPETVFIPYNLKLQKKHSKYTMIKAIPISINYVLLDILM